MDNSEANYALTGPTGVFNYTAAPGQVGFPASVAAAPLPAFPAGAQAPLRSLYIRPGDAAYLNQFFPTITLIGYPNRLLNPYSEQWTLRHRAPPRAGWVLSVGLRRLAHAERINRPLDVDPPAPFIRTAPGPDPHARRPPIAPGRIGSGGTAANANDVQPDTRLPIRSRRMRVIQSDVNDGYCLVTTRWMST